jgi:hypothetical protein
VSDTIKREKDIFIKEVTDFCNKYPEEITRVFAVGLGVLMYQKQELSSMAAEMEYAATLALHGQKDGAKNKLKPFHGKSFTNLDWLFQKESTEKESE